MARIPKRLAGPVSRTGGGANTEYTCAAVSTTFTKSVIRQVHLVETSGIAGNVLIGIGTSPPTATKQIVNYNISASETKDFPFPDTAVEAGELITSQVTTATVTITISGADIVPSG